MPWNSQNSFESHFLFLKSFQNYIVQVKKSMQRKKSFVCVSVLLSRYQYYSLCLEQCTRSTLRRFTVSHRWFSHKPPTNLVTIQYDCIEIGDVVIRLKTLCRFYSRKLFSKSFVLIFNSLYHKTYHFHKIGFRKCIF